MNNPCVGRLPAHLPNEQNVYFNEDNAVDALLRAELKKTELMGWFALNSTENRSPYIYLETPVHYSWDRARQFWKKRTKRIKVIGGMYSISPNEIERYHL
jgi:hypothetical protein